MARGAGCVAAARPAWQGAWRRRALPGRVLGGGAPCLAGCLAAARPAWQGAWRRRALPGRVSGFGAHCLAWCLVSTRARWQVASRWRDLPGRLLGGGAPFRFWALALGSFSMSLCSTRKLNTCDIQHVHLSIINAQAVHADMQSSSSYSSMEPDCYWKQGKPRRNQCITCGGTDIYGQTKRMRGNTTKNLNYCTRCWLQEHARQFQCVCTCSLCLPHFTDTVSTTATMTTSTHRGHSQSAVPPPPPPRHNNVPNIPDPPPPPTRPDPRNFYVARIHESSTPLLPLENSPASVSQGMPHHDDLAGVYDAFIHYSERFCYELMPPISEAVSQLLEHKIEQALGSDLNGVVLSKKPELCLSGNSCVAHFGSWVYQGLHQGSDLDFVLPLDNWDNKNLVLWQHLILRRVWDSCDTAPLQMKSNDADRKNTITLSYTVEDATTLIDLHVFVGTLTHFREFKDATTLKNRLDDLVAVGIAFAPHFVRIVVGWASKADLRKRCYLKTCHLATLAVAWMFHYKTMLKAHGDCRDGLAVAVQEFFTWALHFKWSRYEITLEVIRLRMIQTSSAMFIGRGTYNLTHKVTAVSLSRFLEAINLLFAEGKFRHRIFLEALMMK